MKNYSKVIEDLIDLEFLQYLKEETQRVFGFSEDDYAEDTYFIAKSKPEWAVIVKAACIEKDKPELLEKIFNMSWNEFDKFGLDIISKMVESKMVLFDKLKIVALGLDVKESSLAYCSKCGKLHFIKEMEILDNKDDEDKDYLCKTCSDLLETEDKKKKSVIETAYYNEKVELLNQFHEERRKNIENEQVENPDK